jgi:nucleoside-diphosphate-sugar epimerase
MNVLVTGATGFIGFHVAKLLTEKGFYVKALVSDDEVMHCIEQGLPAVIVNPSTPIGSFDRKLAPFQER